MRPKLASVFVGLVAAAVLAPAGSAQAQVNFERFSVSTTEREQDLLYYATDGFTPGDTADDPINSVPLTQAGSHPAMNIRVDACPNVDNSLPGNEYQKCVAEQQGIDTRDFRLTLPKGMVGNPEAADVCDDATFFSITFPEEYKNCPAGSMVGYISVIGAINFALDPFGPLDYEAYGKGYLFRMKTVGNEPARLGALIFPPGGLNAVHLPVFATVATESDYSISTLQPNQPPDLQGPDGTNVPFKLVSFEISVFGRAGDPTRTDISHPSFLTLPTSCEPVEFKAEINSWGDPNYVSRTVPFQPTGCDSNTPPFTPSIDMRPDDPTPGKPSAQTVEIEFPDSENDNIHQSHLERAEVLLPAGVSLNPGAAIGLESCTDTEFGKGSNMPIACPPASKIGDIEVETPVLDGDRDNPGRDPLEGEVYFGQPKPGDPWRLFLLIEDAGLRIKLEGSAQIDDSTGRIRNVFENLPAVPFTKFSLRLRGGDRAILTNPRDCGDYAITSTLSPANEAGADASPSGSFSLGPCSARGFNPTLDAKSDTEQAGAFVKSRLEVVRADGQQNLTDLDIALPPGMVGSLNTVPLCGLDTAKAGNCGEASEVGRVQTSVGAGGSPLTLPGKIYLAEKSESGDAATLAIVVPSKVGPIDLGKVIVLTRVLLRESDGVIVAKSKLPTIYKGVPLSIRKIDIDVDRENFLQNPTGCDTRRLAVEFGSDENGKATGGKDLTAHSCDALSFAPKLDLTVGGKGATARFAHTPLKAVVSQTSGQSAIRQAKVLLPKILKPDTVNLNKPGALCNDGQIATKTCPLRSRVGTATATSPLLPQPLTGPIYIGQQAGNVLPKLIIYLNGAVALELRAQNTIENLRVNNFFGSVPDVPVTRFELAIDGGSNGILQNGLDLCASKDDADYTFTGHNGKVASGRSTLKVNGCGPKISSSAITMSRNGVASVKVACQGEDACNGAIDLRSTTRAAAKKKRLGRIGRKGFKVAAGKTATVKIKLSKAAQRTIKRKRRLKVTARLSGATVTASAGGPVSKSLTIKAPKKQRKRR